MAWTVQPDIARFPIAIVERWAFTDLRCHSLRALEELQQIFVDLLFVRCAQAVRGALIHL